MLAESVFKRVKANVTARDIALKCGLKQGKNGLFLCPFHPDRNPSMKAEKNFYCFGCGEKGDSIRLAEKLTGKTTLEAAYMIADEYGIDVSDCASEKHKGKMLKRNTKEEVHRTDEHLRERYIDDLVGYLLILYEWQDRYSPSISEVDDPDSRYLEAIRYIPYSEYLLGLLIDDKLRSGLSSEDLTSLMGKVLKRMSSVIPEGG